jgi:hypothetical protein
MTACTMARFRWACDIQNEPMEGFQDLLTLLPDAEQAQVRAADVQTGAMLTPIVSQNHSGTVGPLQILRFVQHIDQRRTLTSRLLQRCAVSLGLGVPFEAVRLAPLAAPSAAVPSATAQTRLPAQHTA